MFLQLLDNSMRVEPGVLQAEARFEFPEVLANSRLRKRVPNSPIFSNLESNVILGIATYSRPELELLDQLHDSVSRWKSRFEIAVFDLAGCRNLEEVRGFLPTEEPITQSPAMGVWVQDKLTLFQTGLFRVREALHKLGILD